MIQFLANLRRRCAEFGRSSSRPVPETGEAAAAGVSDEAQRHSPATTTVILELDLFRGRPMSALFVSPTRDHGVDDK